MFSGNAFLEGGIMDMHQEIEKLSNKLHQLEADHWIHNDVFSFQWWIILSVNAIFFAFLVFFIDRKRIVQIALAYMICYFLVNLTDDIGEFYGRWSYQHQFIAFTSEFDAVDFAVVPVSITLLYQIFNEWRKYLIAGIIISYIYTFIGLPLFIYLGITKINNWNYFNSFLVLIVTCIFVKIITDFITRLSHQLKQPEHEGIKLNFRYFRSKKKAR
jgi:hypothetical protein